ncbi:hypothetical protein P8452_25596 [Trifolium repens]|nr:hypothetical protein P8452_25596 [Trifolium repens]
MSGKKCLALFVPLMVLCMLMITLDARQVDDITCSEAISSLLPCVPFLEGSLPATPSSDCCAGVTNIVNKANTTPIRRSTCQCLKNASTKFGVNVGRAKQLPQLCHVSLPFVIDPNVDCNSIP